MVFTFKGDLPPFSLSSSSLSSALIQFFLHQYPYSKWCPNFVCSSTRFPIPQCLVKKVVRVLRGIPNNTRASPPLMVGIGVAEVVDPHLAAEGDVVVSGESGGGETARGGVGRV